MKTKFRSYLTALLFLPCTILGKESNWNKETKFLYKELPFKMEELSAPKIGKKIVSITDFNAKPDGITMNTEAFAKAIDHLSKQGGGTVLVPKGLWLTGPIELKSHVRLHTERGAVILFTDDYDQYPLVQTYYEGQYGWRVMSPLYALKAENIAITGEGIFDGNGQAWRPVKMGNVTSYHWRDLLKSGGVLNSEKNVWYPTERALLGSQCKKMPKERNHQEASDIKEWMRPVMLNFIECKNVLIEDVHFRNSPAWCLHPLLCENLIVTGVTVENEDWAANGDAIDVESCKNVLIYNCIFDAGDDGICMKSGKDKEGRDRGVPTENVIVYDCTVFKGHGGFVVGSEMSGSVRNVFVKNCRFIGTDNGIRFKSTRGRGGVVENIRIEDIYMANIKSDAILYDLYYATKNRNGVVPPVDETTPQFKNIRMKNIVCKGANRAIIFQGLPEMKLQNVELTNATIEAVTGIDCVDAENITLKNVRIINSDNKEKIRIKDSKNIIADIK